MKNLFKTFTILTLTVFIFSSITSCDQKTESTAVAVTVDEPSFDLAAAQTEIEAASSNFMALFAAGDSVGVANLYTEDAKFMNTGAPAVVGTTIINLLSNSDDVAYKEYSCYPVWTPIPAHRYGSRQGMF